MSVSLQDCAERLGINDQRLHSDSRTSWPIDEETLHSWERDPPSWLVEARRRERVQRPRAADRYRSHTPNPADRWGEIEAFFSSLLESAVADGRCSGWELDDATYEGGGRIAAKIGIYPWGKTIDTRTRAGWRRFVEKVLDQIAEGAMCPGCRSMQSVMHLDKNAWRCACGTQFFVQHGYAANMGIIGSFAWPAFQEALLQAGTDTRAAEAAVHLVEDGTDVEAVFNGAGTIEVLHTVVHYITSAARPKTPPETATATLIESALRETGFTRVTSGYRDNGHEWYQGTVGDSDVLVVLEDRYDLADPDAFDFSVAFSESSKLLLADVNQDDLDVVDELVESWESYCPVTQGQWDIEASVFVGDELFCLGARFNDAILPFSSLEEAKTWLKWSLGSAVKVCLAQLSAFQETRSTTATS